jgi:hypothetical protein
MIGVIPLVEGDGYLRPSEPHWSGKGVNDIHLLLGDVAQPTGFVCLGAPEDHEVAIDLGELGVVLWSGVRWLASLWGWLLGLALLAVGATDVAPNDGAVLEEVLHLPSMERAEGFECLPEVFGACIAPVGLRPGDVVGHGHHLLPTVLSVLILLVAVTLG